MELIITAETARDIRTKSQKDIVSHTLRTIEKKIREASEMGQFKIIVFETLNPQINTALRNAGYQIKEEHICDYIRGIYLYFTTIKF